MSDSYCRSEHPALHPRMSRNTWTQSQIIWVCRALLLCEEIGLWGTAHTDGSIILRLLPTGDADERHTLTVDPNGPVPALNIPHFRAPFCVSASQLHLLAGSPV